MAKDIVMPKMGYDMTEGKLLRWLKHEGDTVTKGEAIAEIETDKVNIEVEAFDSGILQRVVVPEGETVPVGELIGVLTAPGEEVPAPEEARAMEAPVTTPAVEAPPPPATATAAARGGGNGYAATTAATATTATTAATVPAATGSASADTQTGGEEGGRVKASPLARRLAQEHGIDLAAIRGTGPGGRVTREDVLGAADAGIAATTRQPAPASAPAPVAASAPVAAAAPPPVARSAPAAGAHAQPLTRLQQTVARRMVESKTQAPHFYLTIGVDMTDAVALRAQLNAQAGDGVKISLNDLVVKAAAKALRAFPVLNASFAGDALALHEEISIAVAVATDAGLVTPVVQHADQKALGQIAQESKALAERARTGKSRLEDYEGGTFTVSNLGMFDIDTFVAILNPPQAGILAVGALRRVPVYVGDELTPREQVSLTLSVDHRVTDGATGARFLGEVRALLEQPLRLVI